MDETASAGRTLGMSRAAIGLQQGIALYLTYLAYDHKAWPATNWLIFAPLVLAFLLVPPMVAQGLGTVRLGTLAIWGTLAAAIIATLGAYDVWHTRPDEIGFGPSGTRQPDFLASPQLLLALVAGLFLAHSLVTATDIDRRFPPAYPTLFDAATKLAVQAVLSVLFTGVFWLMLFLGASLFSLIRIMAVQRILGHFWFSIPVTTIAVAIAIHVTDVRAGIVRGIRTLGLVLLSWLLPLMTAMTLSFLIALLFTGLQPLWDTRFAASLLLLAAAVLIGLINAAYQDGDPAQPVPRLLRYPGSLAVLALAVLAVLAYQAVVLRVTQYGWTADRIYAMACVMVTAFCAAGYAVAACWPRGPWFKRIEHWNIYTALVALAVLIALFSPIADPYRISVASQVSRLESGATAPEKFDFENLRFAGGRYGYEALETLKMTEATSRAAFVREMAESAAKATRRSRFSANTEEAEPRVMDRVDVRTPGKTLPASFLPQNLQGSFGCLIANMTARCDAWVEDIDADGADEVLFMEGMMLHALREDSTGKWIQMGYWPLPFGCDKLREAMQMGEMHLVPPVSPPPDVEIAGLRLPFAPTAINRTPPACPR